MQVLHKFVETEETTRLVTSLDTLLADFGYDSRLHYVSQVYRITAFNCLEHCIVCEVVMRLTGQYELVIKAGSLKLVQPLEHLTDRKLVFHMATAVGIEMKETEGWTDFVWFLISKVRIPAWLAFTNSYAYRKGFYEFVDPDGLNIILKGFTLKFSGKKYSKDNIDQLYRDYWSKYLDVEMSQAECGTTEKATKRPKSRKEENHVNQTRDSRGRFVSMKKQA